MAVAQVPDDWTVNQDDTCTTFRKAAGDDALQVSSYRKSDGAVTVDDLREFGADRAGFVRAEPFETEHFVGLTWNIVDGDGIYRREWLLSSGQLMVFATYSWNGSGSSEGSTARQIVDSLKPVEAVPSN